VISAITGPDIAVIDSATATASALASLLEVHGMGAPRDRAAEHVALTTGDVAAFARTAAVLFGSDPPPVSPVAVTPVAARAAVAIERAGAAAASDAPGRTVVA
jgi:glutamate racemase